MDYRHISESINIEMIKISEKLSKDRQKYNIYIEESRRIAFGLLNKVTKGETQIVDMENKLITLKKKIKSQGKYLDNSMYSIRIRKVFTHTTWQKRNANYLNILKKNNTNIKIFNSEINIDNIDDTKRYQEYQELYNIKEIITKQYNKEKAFFT
jgi:hypothetical protein